MVCPRARVSKSLGVEGFRSTAVGLQTHRFTGNTADPGLTKNLISRVHALGLDVAIPDLSQIASSNVGTLRSTPHDRYPT